MGFGSKFKRLYRKIQVRPYKKLRQHLGLTGKNRFIRQLKRSISGLSASPVSSYQPTSASDTTWTYQPRRISEMM